MLIDAVASEPLATAVADPHNDELDITGGVAVEVLTSLG